MTRTTDLEALWRIFWGRSNRFNEVTINQQELAAELGLSGDRVYRFVQELLDCGALTIRRGGLRGTPKTFKVKEPPARIMRNP